MARRFFHHAAATLKVRRSEDDLAPAAWHHVEQYENHRIEAPPQVRRVRFKADVPRVSKPQVLEMASHVDTQVWAFGSWHLDGSHR